MLYRLMIYSMALFSCLGISAQVHSNAFGLTVRESGLRSMYYKSTSGTHNLAHKASNPHPGVDSQRDVLQYEFYAPINPEINITVTPHALRDRVTVRPFGSFGGVPVWMLVVDVLHDVAQSNGLLLDTFQVSITWDSPLAAAQYLKPPASGVFLNPTWKPRNLASRKQNEQTLSTVDPKTWYDADARYVKIHTSRDGIAVLHAKDVVTDEKSVPFEEVALYWRGVEQPISIDDADSSGTFTSKDHLFFRGRRAQGDSAYYDIHDSVAVFFVTTNATLGQRKRMGRFVFAANANDTIRSVHVRQHFELDTGYYHPGSGIDDDHSIFESSLVFLEGFYWRNLYGRSRQHASFITRFTPAKSGKTNIAVRYATTTANAKYSPEHIVGMWPPAQQSPVYQEVEGYQKVEHTWSKESALMPSGIQKIIVQATGSDELRKQPDWYSEILIDAIEISGDASTVLDSGRLHCTVSAANNSLIELANTRSSVVYVLDTANATFGKVVNQTRGSTVRAGVWADIVPDVPWNGLTFSASVTISSHTVVLDSLKASYALVGIDTSVGNVVTHRDLTATQLRARLEDIPTDNLIVVVSAGGAPDKTLIDYLRARGVDAKDTESNNVWIAASANGKGAFSNDNGLTAYFPDPTGTDGVATIFVPPGVHTLFVSDTSGIEMARAYAAKNQGVSRDTVFGDIIAIAHRDYLQEASRWAKHRYARSGKSVRLYDVDAVFEEYDAGRRGPQAIRAFLADAYSKASIKPTHCVLIGNASWDPRLAVKGGNVGARRTDQVPTYGRPSTDMWFGLLDDEQDVAVPELIVTRMPASTVGECRSMIDKIISTDTLPYHPNMRKFLFVGGGTLEENFCDMYKRMLDDSFGSEIVFTAPPLCIDTVTVCNTDYSAPGLEIRRKINDGVGWMNYIGHGGTDVFDINDWDPEDLNNSNRYPILATFSCLTGNYSSPNSACENASYLTEQDRGVVAAMGSTGYQYLPIVDLMHFRFHEAMLLKGLRTIGDLTYEAKRAFATMNNQIGRNAALQYCILGDPFTRLRIDTIPDLRVYSNSIGVQGTDGTPNVYAQQDSFRVIVDIVNSGIATLRPIDVVVRRFVKESALTLDSANVTIPQDVCSQYRFSVTFPTRTAGEHIVQVHIDPTMSSNDDTLYNTASHAFLIVNRSLGVIDPDEYGVVDLTNAKFRLLYPSYPDGSEVDSVTFGIYDSYQDAVRGLDPVIDSYGVSYGQVYVDILAQPTTQEMNNISEDRLYWLCARSSDSEPMIRPFSFTKSFVDAEQHRVFAGYMGQNTDSVVYDPATNSLSLASYPVSLNLQSSGSPTSDPVRVPSLRIAFGDTVIQSSFRNGLNIAVIRPFSNRPRVIRRYDTSPNPAPIETGHSGGALECLAFIQDSVMPHEIIALAACNESFTQFMQLNLRDSLARLLKQYGSMRSGALEVGNSYVFVGSRDTTFVPLEVLEQTANNKIARIDTTLLIRYSAAALRPIVVVRPRAMKIATHSNGNGVVGIVERKGYDNSIAVDTMEASWTAPRNMSTLKRVTFIPLLQASDSAPNPRYRDLSISYTPGPMLLLDGRSISVEPSISYRGDSVDVTYALQNLHIRHKADNIAVVAALKGTTDTVEQQLSTFNIVGLAADQKFAFTIRGRNNPRWDSVTAMYSASWPGVDQMLYPFYSSAFITYTPREDVKAPSIEVLANNRNVRGGEYVNSLPQFLVKIKDESLIEIRSEENIVLFVNGIRIRPLTAPNYQFFTTQECSSLFPNETIRAAVRFDFPMEQGENLLIVRATDASGNKDTAEIFLTYKPESTVEVLTYGPNPNTGRATFTVSTSASDANASFVLRMHDVQGRLILTKEFTLPVGTSTFVIDVELELGSTLAPGVYTWTLAPQADSMVGVDNTPSGIIVIVR